MIRYLQRLHEIAPLGYAVGVHIRFAKPLFSTSTLPQSWQDAYTRNGYALRDPTIFWGISKSGSIRWSEITLPDPFGVMEQAAQSGLPFGATVSCGKITSRTLVGVTSDEREFADAEIAEVLEIAQGLHELGGPLAELTPAMIETLRVAGDSASDSVAAARIGITEGAFVARLGEAQRKLGAATVDEAVGVAREFQLI